MSAIGSLFVKLAGEPDRARANLALLAGLTLLLGAGLIGASF
jgi:hypothetical protein